MRYLLQRRCVSAHNPVGLFDFFRDYADDTAIVRSDTSV